VSTGVLVFMVASTAILIRILQAGVIGTGFDQDVHVAASLARRYLQTPFGTEVADMYTQGFLHPLLYVPLLTLLRAIGITPLLQDGLAIAFVQAVAVGLITLLAYIGSRSLLNQGPALAVSFLCIGPPLLLRPVDSAITQLSPNGEILGSVLLLGIWALLVNRSGRGAVAGVIGLSVAAFHLKYQLVPQVAALILGGGLGRLRALRLLAIALVACLLADLLVYRLAGPGIFSRVGSLLTDYMGIAGSGTPAGSGFSLRGVAVWLVIQLSTLAGNAGNILSGWVGNLRSIATEAPQFLLAWAVWLLPLLRPLQHGPHFRGDLKGGLLLSLATIAAIFLPGKGFNHYYLLLIPTAVVVMATGLAQVSSFARRTAVPTELRASMSALPHANACWAALLAVAPATALLFGSGLHLNRELLARGSPSKAVLPVETRMAGLHVYGWNFRLFGLQDTHTIDPNLDVLLATSWMKQDTSDYIRALTGPANRPRYVLDHVASPNKGGILAGANYPPLTELARRHGINLLALYKVRQQNELGILYERISEPPARSGGSIGAEVNTQQK
jgi:hypothetical protein